MLVLKKLSAAERDGDHIHGLVRSTAENHGGRSNSLTAPNPKAQAALIQRARQGGHRPPDSRLHRGPRHRHQAGRPHRDQRTQGAYRELYEAHGATVQEAHCGVGSVKTNIGHLEVAAGVAG